MTDYQRARQRMVETQIAARGVRDRRVLAAMREVPREQFVDPGLEEFAYEDSPLQPVNSIAAPAGQKMLRAGVFERVKSEGGFSASGIRYGYSPRCGRVRSMASCSRPPFRSTFPGSSSRPL